MTAAENMSTHSHHNSRSRLLDELDVLQLVIAYKPVRPLPPSRIVRGRLPMWSAALCRPSH
eukprot:6214396-Pleurochrysis_carterae.AAC.2